MYEVLKKGRLHNLSIKSQYDLFDKIVKSILLYGCGIWGFGNIDIIERVHLKFCKVNFEFYDIWRTWHLSYVSLYRTTHD